MVAVTQQSMWNVIKDYSESKKQQVFNADKPVTSQDAQLARTFPKKFVGYTTKRVGYEKEAQNKLMNILKVQFQERQICVSDKECIKSVKLIYNEKEEVI